MDLRGIDVLKVECGGVQGQFVLSRSRVVAQGLDLSPPEFERLGGKAQAKKWKQSIKVMDHTRRVGMSIGDWMAENGFEEKDPKDTPMGAAAAAAAAAALMAVAGSSQQHFLDGGGGGGGAFMPQGFGHPLLQGLMDPQALNLIGGGQQLLQGQGFLMQQMLPAQQGSLSGPAFPPPMHTHGSGAAMGAHLQPLPFQGPAQPGLQGMALGPGANQMFGSSGPQFQPLQQGQGPMAMQPQMQPLPQQQQQQQQWEPQRFIGMGPPGGGGGGGGGFEARQAQGPVFRVSGPVGPVYAGDQNTMQSMVQQSGNVVNFYQQPDGQSSMPGPGGWGSGSVFPPGGGSMQQPQASSAPNGGMAIGGMGWQQSSAGPLVPQGQYGPQPGLGSAPLLQGPGSMSAVQSSPMPQAMSHPYGQSQPFQSQQPQQQQACQPQGMLWSDQGMQQMMPPASQFQQPQQQQQQQHYVLPYSFPGGTGQGSTAPPPQQQQQTSHFAMMSQQQPTGPSLPPGQQQQQQFSRAVQGGPSAAAGAGAEYTFVQPSGPQQPQPMAPGQAFPNGQNGSQSTVTRFESAELTEVDGKLALSVVMPNGTRILVNMPANVSQGFNNAAHAAGNAAASAQGKPPASSTPPGGTGAAGAAPSQSDMQSMQSILMQGPAFG